MRKGGETKLREREEPRFRVAAAQVGNEKKREMAKRVFGLLATRIIVRRGVWDL